MAKKTNTPSKKSTGNVVVQNLTLQTLNRQTQEIGKWRSAIKSADSITNPNRTTLYDLLEDTLLDGHLTSVLQKRRDAVKNIPLVFARNGKEDEEINKVLQSPDLLNLIEDLIDTIFWGYTVVQINSIFLDEEEDIYHIDYDLIPRKHVHPEDGFECISKMQAAVTRDFLFKDPPLSRYMIWAGKPKDFGLLTKAAQYVIYKRGGFGDWAEYAEIFGRPFREARYDGYDEATRIQLEQMMELYGGAGYAILPEKASFMLHQATTAASSNVLYKDFVKACNEELSKLIVGQTMTTEDGSSKSQSETHQDEEDEIKAADKLFIQMIMNSKFKSILALFGFNVAGGSIQYRQSIDLEELKTKVGIMRDVKDLVPLDDDYIYQELAIPKPNNYEQLKEERKAQRVAPALQDPDPKTKNFWSRFFG